MRGLGRPPEIEVNLGPVIGTKLIDVGRSGPFRIIDLNVNFDTIKAHCGPELPFDWSIALLAEATCNRTIASARKIDADLFLAEPISALVGDKLYEQARAIKLENNLQHLKAEVQFPDVRALVNQGSVKLEHILEWRPKTKRFRDWLQSESERDRDAIIAYHDEIGKETGIKGRLKKLLALFGVPLGSAPEPRLA